MKIEQENGFRPITITLETTEEVDAVWKAIQDSFKTYQTGDWRQIHTDTLAAISDWFSNEASL